MRQAGVSVRPEALWSDHEWEEVSAPREETTTPTDAPAHAYPSVPTPPARGVQARSGVIAPTRSRADESGRPLRGGPTRPGARAPGSSARGVPARSGAIAPTRSRADVPGRPAQGGSSPTDSRPAARPPTSARPGAGVPGRRTVKIQGRGAERHLIYSSRRPQRRPSERPYERAGFRPDRVAMWAVLLGVLLILVAATSSHAAVSSRAAPGSHGSGAPVAAVGQHVSRIARGARR
jgi:hypothetical protein